MRDVARRAASPIATTTASARVCTPASTSGMPAEARTRCSGQWRHSTATPCCAALRCASGSLRADAVWRTRCTACRWCATASSCASGASAPRASRGTYSATQAGLGPSHLRSPLRWRISSARYTPMWCGPACAYMSFDRPSSDTPACTHRRTHRHTRTQRGTRVRCAPPCARARSAHSNTPRHASHAHRVRCARCVPSTCTSVRVRDAARCTYEVDAEPLLGVDDVLAPLATRGILLGAQSLLTRHLGGRAYDAAHRGRRGAARGECGRAGRGRRRGADGGVLDLAAHGV